MQVRVNKLEIPPEVLRGLQASFDVEHAAGLGQFEFDFVEQGAVVNRIKVFVHQEEARSALAALSRLGAKAYAAERSSRTLMFFFEKPREVQALLDFANQQRLVPMVRFFLVSSFKEILAVASNLANTRHILEDLSEFEAELKQKLSQLKKGLAR